MTDKKKNKKPLPPTNCEMCVYFDTDEETGEEMCTVNLDEDEMAQFVAYANRDCPYFKFYDEYKFVQKQN